MVKTQIDLVCKKDMENLLGMSKYMKKLNVLFVITNINGYYDDAYSFGLASLASVTGNKGFDFEYAVINKPQDNIDFLHLVETKKPDIIAYTSVSSQFIFVKELSKTIHDKYADIIQVCGGVHPTIFPECLFEAPALDGIFIGESELAFSDFLNKVANNLPYKDTKNLAYIENGKFIKNELYPLITDLDILPFPERKKYNYRRFVEKRDGQVRFIFNRGCPYLCAYCSNHAVAKVYGMKANTPRYKSPGKCIDEILEVTKEYSATKIGIIDDTFGLNKQWAKEFCNKYAEKVHLPFACFLRVNMVDEELVRLLKDGGCTNVSCGIESGNEYIRNTVMKRNISEEQVIKAYKLFDKYKILAKAFNMIGLPYETLDNIWDTIKLNRKIKPYGGGVAIFYPYKGTELGNECFKNGLVDEKAYNTFTTERRDSVLKFPPKFKKQLLFMHENWDLFAYSKRPLIYAVTRQYTLQKLPYLWKILGIIKRMIKKGE